MVGQIESAILTKNCVLQNGRPRLRLAIARASSIPHHISRSRGSVPQDDTRFAGGSWAAERSPPPPPALILPRIEFCEASRRTGGPKARKPTSPGQRPGFGVSERSSPGWTTPLAPDFVPPFQGLNPMAVRTQGVALGWLGAAPLVLNATEQRPQIPKT